jgi:protein-disulfide isomerase
VTVPKAFISGAPDNDPVVGQLVEQLRLLGYPTSVDPPLPGDRASWERALRAIAECDVFIPIISTASVDSVSASRQVDWAERLAKPVLSVVVQPPAKALPPWFSTHQIIDYSDLAQRDQSASMLAETLASLRPAPPLPDPLPQPPAAPRSTAARKRRWIRAAVLIVAVAVGPALWLNGLLPGTDTKPVKLVELDNGVLIGSSRAATTIDVFDEPMCPSCAQLAASSDGDIRRAVNDKKIAVRYHLLDVENGQSASGDYSTRAIAASLCVADTNDPNRYQAFQTALFASDFQPKVKPASTDRTDAELAHLAQTLGAPSSVSNCITSRQRVPAARHEASNADLSLRRLEGTGLVPMIYEGTGEVDYLNTGWLDNLR